MTLALPYRLMYKTNVNYYMLMKFVVIYYALLLFVNKSSYSQSYGFSSCSSVAQSCPTLCNPMDCSTPGFPVPHHLPELAQTPVHWVGDAIQPSRPLSPPPSAFRSFPESEPSLMSQLFASCGQSIGASFSAPVLPMNIQDWLIWSPCTHTHTHNTYISTSEKGI